MHPLTMIGRYSIRWQEIENTQPSGQRIFPVIESDTLPEGIIIVWNRKPLKGREFQWVDIRNPQE